MSKTFSNDAKWIQPPEKLNLDIPYVKGTPLRPINDNIIQYEIVTKNGPLKLQIPNDKTYMMSKGVIYEDMCDMDILNEPQVLNNLIQRYKNDKIFTFIGPTLVVVNPYRVIQQYFNEEAMARIRSKIIEGIQNTQKPHIYLIAGNAFNSMIDQQKKQAIVISGESGAGKTQSTKYCMQLLTSLSHKQTHPIERKILACNPILQAFGNSKTTRNDNSSRFGKYVQIFFQKDHTIVGATMNSYLLQKSRVVAPADKQRNFHIFYALIASGIILLKKPQDYKYLSSSKCYDAKGIDDKQFFMEIQASMNNLGFSEKDQKKIWELLTSILQVGNLQFDDTIHKQKQSEPCKLKDESKKNLQKLSTLLNIKQADLQKILLFQKKIMLKQVTFSAYNKVKCIANANTLSKAIYNAIFEFILYKIQNCLKPQQNKKYLSINILDIFGFQNFQINSFEQFCINFTNQKLLKLYNQYVFERQMKILKQDGLDQHISQIKAPTNDHIIDTISGKLSLFSIINDKTIPTQFKDGDMIAGFQSDIKKAECLIFDKLNKMKFTIIHSQCNVKYDVQGFKQKNQDKVLPQIANIVNNLFQHESKDQVGKTLLIKFSKQIEDLMQELTSSNVHFIRCIKPNEKKIPNSPEDKYMLTQIRYLGVFQTIQIRKKTFPSRWIYNQFIQRFQPLFPLSKGSNIQKTKKIMQQLTKDAKEYLLGNQRVYMNSQLQSKLSKKLHEVMKKKIQSGKKIWKYYKKYKFKKQIIVKLKLLCKRIKIWRKIAAKKQLQTLKNKFMLIKQFAKQKFARQKQAEVKLLMQSKKKRQEEQKKKELQKMAKRKDVLPLIFKKLCLKMRQNYVFCFEGLKQVKPKVVNIVNKPQPHPPGTTKNSQYQKKLNQKSQILTDLDQTVFQQSFSSTAPNKYDRNVKKVQKQKDFDIHQSFLNQKSILIQNKSDIAFKGTLSVPFFNPKQATGLKKLKTILSDSYKPQYNQKSEDYLSPGSSDAQFKLQDTPNQIMTKIIQFDSKQFFKKVLRKRTNFFGMSKDEDDILVTKNRPISKSVTLLNQQDQKQAIQTFKQILKISEQPKLDLVFKQIDKFIITCKNGTPQLINEVLLQLIKQSNTTNQLISIRVIQALTVFLHLYDPDTDFLLASLNFVFKKLAENSYNDRQAQYFRYVFKKMVRKFQKNVQISYMPIKYQIMALMCKRMISIPIYLPVGSCTHVKIQSYETLEDIKIKAMQQLGVDHKRLSKEFFTFFQLTNFDGISEQRPLNQNISVWDIISYWQRSTQKYTEQNEIPPVFYLVLKLRYVYECHQSDQQSIELLFGQTFFDYFMGRIKLGLKQIGAMAACIKKIKYANKQAEQYKECYPHWALQKWSEKELIKEMYNGVFALSQSQHSEIDIKFKFIQVAQQAPLSISLTVPTQQQIRLHFRHKMIYVSQNNQVIEEIPIKSITKYAQQQDKFVFSIRNSTQNKVIYTEHASICCKYMSLLQDLVTKKINSLKINASNNTSNILSQL